MASQVITQPRISLTSGMKPLSESDQFLWSYTEEPHRTRRQAIIKAHPEVQTIWAPKWTWLTDEYWKVIKLCGPEPLTKYCVILVVALQLLCALALRGSSIVSVQFLFTAYIIGATANQNLFLAIHEISHNLAFKSPLANRLFAIFANLPIGVPYSAAFRVSHLNQTNNPTWFSRSRWLPANSELSHIT